NLELEGYEVVQAPDGRRALQLFEQEPFDLVITDVRMPGLNGVDLFREIRRLRPGTEVVMMTAFAVERLLEDALQEGVYTVLHKPFFMEHIQKIISRAIRGPLVLVVDAPEDAESIASGLRAAGLRAEAAYDGHAALERARQGAVDVCVLALPSQDGE